MHAKRIKLKHLAHISGWLNMRGMDPDLVNDLPEIGYMVFDQNDAVCALFIRQMEGGYVLLDSGISNPSISPPRRNEAQQLVFETCMEHAKDMGAKTVIAFTHDRNVIKRLIEADFGCTKDILMTRKL